MTVRSTISPPAEALPGRLTGPACVAVISIDTAGDVLGWNDVARSTFGWTAAEAIGRPLAGLIVPERHRGAHERGLRRLLECGTEVMGRRLELDARHRDGHELPVELTLARMQVEGRTVLHAFLHDVSERREAEASSRRMARIVDGSDNAIIARDLDGTVRAWNSGAEHVLGYRAEEMIGRSIAPVWRADPDKFEAMQVLLAAGQRVPSFDALAMRADGRVIDVAVRAYPLEDSHGECVGASVIVRNLTEQHAADAQVRLLASLVANSQDAIVAGGLDGTVTSWNPGAERLYGYTAAEMIGQSIDRLRPPRAADGSGAQPVLSAGKCVPTYETRERRKDGTWVDVSVSLSPVHGAAGEVVGVCSIVRDISERKRVQREAHQALRRFESAFEGAPIGMALVTVDGRWLAVNASLCRLLGREEPALLDTTFQVITHPEDLEADLVQLRETLAGRLDGYELEKRYVLPGGGLVWASLHVSLVRDEGGEPLYFVAQMQDISERKRAEEDLRAYSEQLAELALQDPLTGLRNERAFHSLLDSEVERARRHGGRWSVVLFDVDGFRRLNAVEGRARGDAVLAEVGTAIEGARRASDLAARVGGDEFALLLLESSADDAVRAAERIAAEVSSRATDISLTFATGSWPQDGESKELVLRRADVRLQAAKPGSAAPGALTAAATMAERDHATTLGVERILSLAREQLQMEVAYVAETTDEIAGSEAGASVRVPLQQADGRRYGTLCFGRSGSGRAATQRHAELTRFLARLIVDHLDDREQEADGRRSEIELAGINALLSALVARDHYTGEHSKTVVRHAVGVARRLGLEESEVLEVQQVALLHDIGKVGIPDAVLQKRGPLSAQEWELMRQHPAIGARILAASETLCHLAAAVKAEHERFDGTGYPDGLRGDEIPLASGITFACDAYHAMTSDRPYRAALPAAKARAELRAHAGTQFNPTVVDALLAIEEVETPAPSGDQTSRPNQRTEAMTPVNRSSSAVPATRPVTSTSCSSVASSEPSRS